MISTRKEDRAAIVFPIECLPVKTSPKVEHTSDKYAGLLVAQLLLYNYNYSDFLTDFFIGLYDRKIVTSSKICAFASALQICPLFNFAINRSHRTGLSKIRIGLCVTAVSSTEHPLTAAACLPSPGHLLFLLFFFSLYTLFLVASLPSSLLAFRRTIRLSMASRAVFKSVSIPQWSHRFENFRLFLKR